MDLYTLIKQYKDIKECSIKAYEIRLRKFNNDEEITDLNFIDMPTEEIINRIDELENDNTKQNTYIALLVFIDCYLKHLEDQIETVESVSISSFKAWGASTINYDLILNKLKKQHGIYKDKKDVFGKIIYKSNKKKLLDKGTMNKKEKENWTTKEELMKVYSAYKEEVFNTDFNKKFNATKRILLENYLITALYLFINPRRLDYNVFIIKDIKDRQPKMNYLVDDKESGRYFVITEYKTSKCYGDDIIIVPREVNDVLDLYLKYLKKTDPQPLFFNNRGLPQNKNGLGKYISRAFSPTGKKITLNLIRKIIISETTGCQQMDEAINLAKDMKHSVSTQQNFYLKKNIV